MDKNVPSGINLVNNSGLFGYDIHGNYPGNVLQNMTNTQKEWVSINQKSSINNYPRPQGNLPMFNWGLKKEKQERLLGMYEKVLQED